MNLAKSSLSTVATDGQIQWRVFLFSLVRGGMKSRHGISSLSGLVGCTPWRCCKDTHTHTHPPPPALKEKDKEFFEVQTE
jgi:hypothetical protein